MNVSVLPLGRDFSHGCLRSLRETDVAGMLSWMHDAKVARHFARDFMSTTEADALSFVRASWQDVTNVHLAISDGEGTYLGTVSLKDIGAGPGTAEYAIAVTAAARGAGAAQAGTWDLLALAFDVLELDDVWLCVRESNKRAVRFYERIGFSARGRDGAEGRLLLFGMGGDDFDRRRQEAVADKTLGGGACAHVS